MPVQKGTLSITRYQVTGNLSPQFSHTLALRRYAWRPIDEDRNETCVYGWVDPFNILEQPDWEQSHDGGLVYLVLRQDKKSISSDLKKAKKNERLEQVKKERKLDKLTRQHRLAIEEEVHLELLKKETPRVSTYEVLWDIGNRMLYVISSSDNNCDILKNMFEKTFDLDTQLINPCETDIALGERFLNWLIRESTSDAYYHPNMKQTLISVEGPLVFEGGEGIEKMPLHGPDAATSPYCAMALEDEKATLKKCALLFDDLDYQACYKCKIDAEHLQLTGIKLPTPPLPNPRDQIQMRYGSIVELYTLLDNLIAHYINHENQTADSQTDQHTQN